MNQKYALTLSFGIALFLTATLFGKAQEVNLAIAKKSTNCYTTMMDSEAGRAVDGNLTTQSVTDGGIGNNPVHHHYWEVDLGAHYKVNKIKIHNYNQDELHVFMAVRPLWDKSSIDVLKSAVHAHTTATSNPEKGFYQHITTKEATNVLNVNNTIGRYVLIMMPEANDTEVGKTRLQIGEVEVLGENTPLESPLLDATQKAWKADCNSSSKSKTEQCLCWMNKARVNPPLMADFIDKEALPDQHEAEVLAQTIKMLKGETTCPPPKPGRELMKYILKDASSRSSVKTESNTVLYSQFAQIEMNDYLTAQGKYHFDIGMKQCPPSKGGGGNTTLSHCDINGNGDTEKAACLYNAAATGGNPMAAIYAHGNLASGFDMFMAIVTGFTHVRPLFDICNTHPASGDPAETCNFQYIGIHEDPSSGTFILIYETDKPVAYKDKCERASNIAQEFCSEAHLPNFAKPENLAACPDLDNLMVSGVEAFQSSTAEGGIANRAIDTDTNGTFGGGSVTHTQAEEKPWWKVDLKQTRTIQRVEIYNRTDCCWQRLRNIKVFIGNSASNLTEVKSLQGEHHAAKIDIDFPSTQGQFVMIQTDNSGTSSKKDVLSLAEVKVFGQ